MKKILSIVLLVAMLVSLVACNNKNGISMDTETDSNVEGEVLCDLSDYTFIYPMTADSTLRGSVQDAVNEIKTRYGVTLKNTSDWVATTDDMVNLRTDDKEILIGNTNRAETAEVKETLNSALAYAVVQIGNKVVVYGGCDEAVLRALGYFLGCLDSQSLGIERDFHYSHEYLDDLFPAGSPMYTVFSSYSIAYVAEDTNDELQIATALKNEILTLTGKSMTLLADSYSEATMEILVGNTVRTADSALRDLNFFDYRITVSGMKIYLTGGSSAALNWCAEKFLSMLKDGSMQFTDGYVLTEKFDESVFNPIVEDLSLFTPSWQDEFTTPAWMMDFDEKTYAVTFPKDSTNGRVTIKAHRGDLENYPENSIEALASAILAGADAVEVDVQVTKDGVAVLMHDNTLTRMTNVSSMRGKNGLPDSSVVSDWTYEELRELSLKDVHGNVTSYKIPTLYEALLLCDGRVFIQVDDKSGTISNNKLFEMAKTTDSLECFFHYYGLDLMKTWASKVPGDAEFAAYVAKCEEYLCESGHKLVSPIWPKDVINSYGNGNLDETEARWNKLYNEGYRMFWTQEVWKLSKYVSEHFSATR